MVEYLEAYRNKRVFITGHNGFKGSWLVKLLSDLTPHIKGYSLANTNEYSHFDLLNIKMESQIGDVTDKESLLKSLIEFKPDIVFHLAAQPLVRASYENPYNTYNTNVMGTLNLLESIRINNKKIASVFVTTDKVYENKEIYYPYREIDRLGGYDLYSSSKACCELLIESYINSFFNKKDYGIKHQTLISTVRAGNVIGGGDWSKDRLIPDIARSTTKKQDVNIRNPKAVRPWQHVLDCLNGYLMVGANLLAEKVELATAYNFAPYPHESVTVAQMAESAKKHWNEINFSYNLDSTQPHEANILKLDISKALTLLEWKPRWSTETAIENTIVWYKNFHDFRKIDTQQNIDSFFKNN